MLAGVIVGYAGATAADAQASHSDSAQPIPEVTVTAHKLIDERTLDRIIIPRFVKSHGMPNPRSNQVGRWTRPYLICPSTIGLNPPAADYVSRRVIAVARSVGAPAAVYGHCRTSVEIIFSPIPREQLSYFGKAYRTLLGNDGRPLKDLINLTHPIGAWYSSATHTSRGWSVDTGDMIVNDEALGSSSRLSVEMSSGFFNVLVIADAKQVREHSLSSIADYIAMLVLTRTSIDGCSELASIIDLLSADCAGRAPPDSITPADIAYLKALYSADLQMNLNIEQGDMHDRMSQEVLGR